MQRCAKPRPGGNPRNPKTLNSLTHSSTSTVLYENGEDLELDETLFSVTKVTEGGNLRALKDENSRSVVAREKSNARALAVNENKDFDAVILVEGIKVSFLVDTGASINILTLRTYNDLTKKLQKRLSLQKTNISVVTYGSKGSIIKVMGKIELTIETKNKFCCETFYVIDTAHKNLLSGKSAMALEILSFKKPIYHVQREPDVKDTLSKNKNKYEKKSSVPECLKPLINEFTKDVLSNNKIGKLKDYQVTLHIDKNITPVAQRERRIPFALREKVNKELEKLEKAGIIEDVTNEPTPWLNPLVIAPKPEGKIRLCLDMRCANKAVKRTNYHTNNRRP